MSVSNILIIISIMANLPIGIFIFYVSQLIVKKINIKKIFCVAKTPNMNNPNKYLYSPENIKLKVDIRDLMYYGIITFFKEAKPKNVNKKSTVTNHENHHIFVNKHNKDLWCLIPMETHINYQPKKIRKIISKKVIPNKNWVWKEKPWN